MPHDLHPPDFGQIDAIALELEPLRIADFLLMLTGLELGIPGALLKEILVGAVKVVKLRTSLGIANGQSRPPR
jgi:hypothetical protein